MQLHLLLRKIALDQLAWSPMGDERAAHHKEPPTHQTIQVAPKSKSACSSEIHAYKHGMKSYAMLRTIVWNCQCRLPRPKGLTLVYSARVCYSLLSDGNGGRSTRAAPLRRSIDRATCWLLAWVLCPRDTHLTCCSGSFLATFWATLGSLPSFKSWACCYGCESARCFCSGGTSLLFCYTFQAIGSAERWFDWLPNAVQASALLVRPVAFRLQRVHDAIRTEMPVCPIGMAYFALVPALTPANFPLVIAVKISFPPMVKVGAIFCPDRLSRL